jgi:predicted DNA-binding transcriptional regulator AlpA
MPKLRARTVYTRDASPSPELAQLAERVAQLERQLQQALQATQPLPTFLTVQDLATLLRTTTRGVEHMRAQGTLPPPCPVAGRRLLWRLTDVSEWLDRSRSAGGKDQ